MVLLDLDFSSRFDRRLDDDLVDSVRIRILVFPSFDFSPVLFSSFSPTELPLREFWSTLVRGGLGGAFWLSDGSVLSPFSFSFDFSVKSVGSGVGMPGLPTASLLWAFEKVGYGRLVRDSRNEAVPERLALSTPGMEERRCLREEAVEVEGVEERPVGASASCSLVEVRLDRPWEDRGWRCFVLGDEGEAVFFERVLSRSRSFSLSGRNMAWARWASREQRGIGRRDGETRRSCRRWFLFRDSLLVHPFGRPHDIIEVYSTSYLEKRKLKLRRSVSKAAASMTRRRDGDPFR